MARLGGDEFAILVPNLAEAAVAGRIAEAIIEVLREPNRPRIGSAPFGCSIGIALYPSDATDRQTLLNHADTALYRAKLEGRGTYPLLRGRHGGSGPRPADPRA